MTDKNKNPWTTEDEKEHFPSVLEWWAVEAFFKSIENNKRWSLKAGFNEWFRKSEEMGSIFNMTLFDQDEDKHFTYYLRSDSTKLKTSKDRFDVRYDECFMKGSYPNYEMSFNDKKNNIKLEIKYHSESLPHWVLQEVTNGWLPMGFGFYRYGFIPKNQLSGTIKVEDKKFTIEGKGYLEHVWGDFWYDNPFSNVSELKKTISIYSKLIKWWLHNHRSQIPKSIKFSTENNPFGYDWSWILLDNGWTIFYGNSLFFIKEGPIAGVLILTKGGQRYETFVDANFKYLKTKKSKELDFEYPIELEISAKKDNKKLKLKFTKTIEPLEHIKKTTGEKLWKGIAVCEVIGKIDGYYSEEGNITNLSGMFKFEPQRQIPNFYKPKF